MSKISVVVALAAVLTASCGGIAPRRTPVEPLVAAEAEYEAIRAGQLTSDDPEWGTGERIAGLAYEYGLVAPLAWGVSMSANALLFSVNEAVQVIGFPMHWWGIQDSANDLTISIYHLGPSFDRVHDLAPQAPGGASRTADPNPSLPHPRRGEAPGSP